MAKAVKDNEKKGRQAPTKECANCHKMVPTGYNTCPKCKVSTRFITKRGVVDTAMRATTQKQSGRSAHPVQMVEGINGHVQQLLEKTADFAAAHGGTDKAKELLVPVKEFVELMGGFEAAVAALDTIKNIRTKIK
jgi:hypothetical protein